MSDTELEQTPEGQLRINIMNLMTHPGYLVYKTYLEKWKEQALAEVIVKDKSDKEKGEFTAYGRVLNLPEYILQTLNNKTPEINLDAYKDE